MQDAYFKPYPPADDRTVAHNYLKKWAEGFRKNRTKQPFLVSEEWRLTLFPNADQKQVYQGPLTTFKAKSALPLVSLSVEEGVAGPSSVQQQMDEIFGQSDTSLGEWDVLERDIADDETDENISVLSTPGRASEEDTGSERDSIRTDERNFAPSRAEEQELIASSEYQQILVEEQRGLGESTQEHVVIHMEVEDYSDSAAVVASQRRQEEEEEALRQAVVESQKIANLQMEKAALEASLREAQAAARSMDASKGAVSKHPPGLPIRSPPGLGMNNVVPLTSAPGSSGTQVTMLGKPTVQPIEKAQTSSEALEQLPSQVPVQGTDFKALMMEMTLNFQRQMKENQAALLAESEKRMRETQKEALEEQRRALKKQEQMNQQLIAREAARALAKQQALEAEISALKAAPAHPRLPVASSLPSCDPSNPWIEGHRIPKTEDGYYVLPNKGTHHLDDLEFSPKDGKFPDVWVRLVADIANKEDILVNETLIWTQDRAQSSYRRLLKKGAATHTGHTLPGKKLSMYTAPDRQIFPYAEKVFLSLKAAWREDKGRFPFLKEYDAVSLLCPSPSEDWKDCFSTFKAGRLPTTVARDLFHENLPLIPAKYLREEFESRSDLARALSVQAMTEFSISRNKAVEIPEGLPDNAKPLVEIKKDDYDALRLIAKTHSLAFAKALFRFGEARRTCRKLVFASATVKHEPERLINSSIWGESLFPEAIVQEIKKNAEKADKSLMSKWGMPSFDNKRKGQGEMGPPKKKKKYSPAYRPLPRDSPAYNQKFENKSSNFRGGYRGQGTNRGGNYRGKNPKHQHHQQGNQGNQRDNSGHRGGHQSGYTGNRGNRGAGYRGGHHSRGGHSQPRNDNPPPSKQSNPQSSNKN